MNRTTNSSRPKRPSLLELLKNAKPVTEEELRAQRRSYVSSEAAWGSDADEAAYRAALERGDKDEVARLNVEAEKRRRRALEIMDEHGH